MAAKKEAKEKEKVAAKDSTVTDASLDRLKSVLEQRRRSKQQDDMEDKPTPSPPVSLGPAGAIVDALINTAPEKLLELTDFDRPQVSLVPQVVVIDDMWDYLEHLLSYRSDSSHYLKIHSHYPSIGGIWASTDNLFDCFFGINRFIQVTIDFTMKVDQCGFITQ